MTKTTALGLLAAFGFIFHGEVTFADEGDASRSDLTNPIPDAARIEQSTHPPDYHCCKSGSCEPTPSESCPGDHSPGATPQELRGAFQRSLDVALPRVRQRGYLWPSTASFGDVLTRINDSENTVFVGKVLVLGGVPRRGRFGRAPAESVVTDCQFIVLESYRGDVAVGAFTVWGGEADGVLVAVSEQAECYPGEVAFLALQTHEGKFYPGTKFGVTYFPDAEIGADAEAYRQYMSVFFRGINAASARGLP